MEHFFQRHKQECVNVNKCRVSIPNENDNILKFKNYKHTEKVPFVVYANIECLLEPIINTHTQKFNCLSEGCPCKCWILLTI